MSTATFTVPLTARVLRAILADIEGVDTLMSKCGCHATEPVPQPINSVVGDLDRDIELRTADRTLAVQAPLTTIPVQTLDTPSIPITSGIVEKGNPFVLQTATPAVPSPIPMPPVSVQTVPSATVPTPPTAATQPATTVQLDSEGLPWDKRIHASTRTKRVGDDTWKLMKGVDKALVEQVKAELRATMAVPTQPAAPRHPAFAEPTNYSGNQSGGYVPPAVVPHLSGSWSPETGHVAGVPAPPVTIVPAPPAPVVTPQPPVVPTAPGAPTTFSDFVTYATNKIVGKQFSRDQLQAACANEGITSMPMLENRPDLIPAIWKFLESISIQASSVGGE